MRRDADPGVTPRTTGALHALVDMAVLGGDRRLLLSCPDAGDRAGLSLPFTRANASHRRNCLNEGTRRSVIALMALAARIGSMGLTGLMEAAF